MCVCVKPHSRNAETAKLDSSARLTNTQQPFQVHVEYNRFEFTCCPVQSSAMSQRIVRGHTHIFRINNVCAHARLAGASMEKWMEWTTTTSHTCVSAHTRGNCYVLATWPGARVCFDRFQSMRLGQRAAGSHVPDINLSPPPSLPHSTSEREHTQQCLRTFTRSLCCC